MSESQRQIEFVPPKSETIRAFARKVCEKLAVQTNDPVYIEPNVMRGFASFLELAAQVQAKRLTAGQLVDNYEE